MSRDRARQILMDAFWDAGAWRRAPAIVPDEFDIAKAAGVMFDPGVATHDESVTNAINAADLFQPREIAHAFVASLTTRKLEYRSALGSYAFARMLPHHEPLTIQGRSVCAVCGAPAGVERIDWNILNFMRFKWGGFGHGVPSYMSFDLAQFGQLPELAPVAEDWAVLERILSVAATQLPRARPDHLERAVSKVVKSNRHERRTLLMILGYAGIVRPRAAEPIYDRFVPFAERRSETELGYPFAAWRGADRVDRDAVRFWFPEISVDSL